MKPTRIVGVAVLALVCFAGGATSARAGNDWQPIDPSLLAQKTPAVEKDADAEAVFWDVRVEDKADDTSVRTVLTHYIRVKVYTERGKESVNQIDIPFVNGRKISDVAGRTIKADGTIVPLKDDAVFERTIVKANGVKVKAKSFAMPSVEPGCVVEYRWKETRSDEIADHVKLDLQRDIPVQRVTYHIKPLQSPYFPYGMRVMNFHCKMENFDKEDGGFYATTLHNVPAFHEEPRMPSENAVRPWLLIYYTEDTKEAPDKYWASTGKRLYERFKDGMKVNDDVKKAAAEIVGTASTPDEKLQKIYDFCRTQIKHAGDDASGLSDAERAKAKDNKQPSDTLKRKLGDDYDVDMLFGALANAAGLEAHVALTGDRDRGDFDPSFPDTYFLNMVAVAVKVGDQWRFCDPSEMYLPYGLLDWHAEGQKALVTDPKAPIFAEVPVSSPDKSVEKRTATLKLSDDGTLEGDVRIEYTGHLAAHHKEINDDDSPEQRQQTLRDMLKDQYSTSEITNIGIENVQDPDKPFVYTFHVRVPGYAQRTGKRLFLQPAFFQHNKPAVFQAAERRYMITFTYPWTEEDTVTINLPTGFALDNADAPEPFGVGEVGRYDVRIGAATDGSMIQYKRTWFWGGASSLYFPAAGYSKLKLVFDEVHQRDEHTISLKQTAATN